MFHFEEVHRSCMASNIKNSTIIFRLIINYQNSQNTLWLATCNIQAVFRNKWRWDIVFNKNFTILLLISIIINCFDTLISRKTEMSDKKNSTMKKIKSFSGDHRTGPFIVFSQNIENRLQLFFIRLACSFDF